MTTDVAGNSQRKGAIRKTGKKPAAGSGGRVRRGAPPTAVYGFKHALVRDAAYESLLKSRRQILHRRLVATSKDGGETWSKPVEDPALIEPV